MFLDRVMIFFLIPFTFYMYLYFLKSITNRIAKHHWLDKKMENIVILACNSLVFKLVIVSSSSSPPNP
jgi:hypothetical protein